MSLWKPLSILLALGLLVSGAYFKGRQDVLKEQAAVQEVFQKQIYAKEQERLASERELKQLQEALAHEALTDPHAFDPCFSPDSLRRLNRIQ